MNYRIKYRLLPSNKQGTVIVKNFESEIYAKVNLDRWLEKKYDYNKMEVISCVEECTSNPVLDLFNAMKRGLNIR